MTADEVRQVIEQLAGLGREAGGVAGDTFRSEIWPLLVKRKFIAGWVNLGSFAVIGWIAAYGWVRAVGAAKRMRRDGFDFDDDGWIVFVFAGLVALTMIGLFTLDDAVQYLTCPECAALKDLADKVLSK